LRNLISLQGNNIGDDEIIQSIEDSLKKNVQKQRILQNRSKQWFRNKLILVGDPTARKTTLLRVLIGLSPLVEDKL